MTPREVVEEWVRRFNSGDAGAISELYHENAVNHQVVREPVSGRSAIAGMFRLEFALANMICIPEVIHEAGDVAILEWKDPLGLRGCGCESQQKAERAQSDYCPRCLLPGLDRHMKAYT